MICPSCQRPAPGDGPFCSGCGSELPPASSFPTATGLAAETDTSARRTSGAAGVGRLSPATSDEDARFMPGAMLGGRYRIIGLVGRGGMGEVYRADDLKLGQAVALKFLPRELDRDETRLRRFLNEARVALKVSHPSVCRVYDIGEVEGHHYLSMEYVDGEDLGSLLRRIGRFPQDRAARVARQICAGLAAAHDRGILHRDLKPANIMIDGQGQAKITDFGLAGLAGDFTGAEVRAGTPAYMAPEQWQGREVTSRSDLFSLGLVLYELFTGERAFGGRTPEEVSRSRETPPTSPGSVVPGLDPAAERIILRCLETDPSRRPESALAVAAALPGGDPLAAALAAGETPSPDLVAAAGARGGLSPVAAWTILTSILAGLLAVFALAPGQQLVQMSGLERPPDYLEERAREILRDLGHDGPTADHLSQFVPDRGYVNHVRRGLPDPEGWSPLAGPRPAAVRYWYRESPRPLYRQSMGSLGNWMGDPPLTLPGMVLTALTPRGSLSYLEAVPLEVSEEDAATGTTPDWTPLFTAADLDPADFAPAPPARTPPVFASHRAAWTGVYPESPDIEIRIEAGAHAGQFVWFRIIEPWDEPFDPTGAPSGFFDRAGEIMGAMFFLIALAVASFLAVRHVRLRRGDMRTAIRLALALGAARLVWLLGAHHYSGINEESLLRSHLAWAAFRICLIWVFYMALEPYARRLWPRMLTAWVRLFDGQFRDPLVGRDVLVGVLAGLGLSLWEIVSRAAAPMLAIAPPEPILSNWSLEAVRGWRQAIAALAGTQTQAVLDLFIPLLVLLLLRLLLRRTWAAVALVSLAGVAILSPGSGDPRLLAVYLAGFIALFWILLLRFGLLATLLSFAVKSLLLSMPVTLDLSAWYAGPGLLTGALLLALTAWGLRAALAGRALIGDQLAVPDQHAAP